MVAAAPLAGRNRRGGGGCCIDCTVGVEGGGGGGQAWRQLEVACSSWQHRGLGLQCYSTGAAVASYTWGLKPYCRTFLVFYGFLPPVGVVATTPASGVCVRVVSRSGSLAGCNDEAAPWGALQALGDAVWWGCPRECHGGGGGNDVLRQFAVPWDSEVNVVSMGVLL